MHRATFLLMTAALAIVLGSFYASAAADVVYYRDGGTTEGYVVLETENEVWIEVNTGGGVATVKIPRASVVKIVRGDTAMTRLKTEYAKRISEMRNPSAQDWFALGIWCESTPLLREEARFCFTNAVAVDPAHVPSRLKLGHVLFEGVWMPYDDMMRARGFVKFRGEWMSVEARDRLLLLEKELEVARERRRAEEAEVRRLEAERALVEARNRPAPAPVAPTVETRTVVVRERILSPVWYGYSSYYSYPYVHASPVRIPTCRTRYPYRPVVQGHRSHSPSVSVSYRKDTHNSSLQVGFEFR